MDRYPALGKYRMVRKVGQGAMGSVYEAVHTEIRHHAAVRILPPEIAQNPQHLARFFHEVQAVNSLRHPGLVGVQESGRLEDGSAYILMDYLAGELLSARLQRTGRLSGAVGLVLMRQVAAAMAAAHADRIVHRALTPDSIMLVPDPELPGGERARVFDFGLAGLRITEQGPWRGVGMELHAAAGRVLGNTTYLSPEQCRGSTEVTGQSDVYALGVILYHCLLGRPPFLAQSAGELLSMHLRDPPDRMRQHDPSVPEDLDALVQRMLAKDPQLRPSMGQVAAALDALGARRSGERIQSLQPLAPPGLQPLAPPGPQLARWSWLLPAGAVAVAALAVGVQGYRLWHAAPGPARPPEKSGEPATARALPAVERTAVRGLVPLPPPTGAQANVALGTGRAVLFATTRYDDSRWPPLKTPTADVREIADDLVNLYGFEVTRIHDPTVEDIRSEIHKLAERKYADGDHLFIMFSGHGDKDETLRKAWIIARDTRAEAKQSAYPYSELREDIDNIPCRHILLVLDVCFGGAFDPSIRDAQTRGREYQETSTHEFIRRKLRYRSRLYISSVDQWTEAPEGQGHSPFAWKFLEALRSGGGPDGVLTWNELTGYLEKLNPEPRGGVFPRTVNSDPGGDFLFVMKNQAAERVAPAGKRPGP